MLDNDYGEFAAVYRLVRRLSTGSTHERVSLMTFDTSLLGERSIVFVGLMGAGKSAVGRRLAKRLDLSFKDADHEIIEAADLSIPEIFEKYGEKHFRDRERAVIQRLLSEGPMVLSTGGGAFMNDETRRGIVEKGLSIWLHADLDTLLERCLRKGGRPLLENDDPRGTLKALMDQRSPTYATADISVESEQESADATTDSVIRALNAYFEDNT